MSGYDLHRQWFDFAFENSDIVSGNHSGVYLWAVELNNRLGWVKKFSFPASQAMAANGIKSYNTYKKVYNDLVEWGFFDVVQESKNQWTACIIALSKIDKAPDKALDKAVITHLTTQSESTCQSTDSIIKPQTTNQETTNHKHTHEEEISFNHRSVEASKKKEKSCAKKEIPGIEEFVAYALSEIPGSDRNIEGWSYSLRAKYDQWKDVGWKDGYGNPIKNWKTKIRNTATHLKPASNAVISQTREQRIDSVTAVGDIAREAIRNARPIGV